MFSLAKLFERRRSRSRNRTLYIYHIIIIFSVASTAFAFIPFCAFSRFPFTDYPNFSWHFRFSTFSSTSLSAREKNRELNAHFALNNCRQKRLKWTNFFSVCVCVFLAATVTGISIIVCYNSRLGRNVKIYFISFARSLILLVVAQLPTATFPRSVCVCVCLRLCTGCCHLVGHA